MSTAVSQQVNATLVLRKDPHPDLTIWHIRPDTGTIPPFKPGQFATIGLPISSGDSGSPHLATRPFSIVSSPHERNHVEVYFSLVPQGELTPHLWPLREGGRLYLKPMAAGRFTLDDVPNEKDMVMVATGTGIGPFISMLRHFRGTNRWGKFVVIHGARTVADLGYRNELEAAARSDASVIYLPTVTREAWPGFRGRVQNILFTDLFPKRVGSSLLPERCHLFLCGNPDMVETVESDLVCRGFRPHKRREPGNIHKESYW